MCSSSNPLNVAARQNDVQTVQRLLKRMSPNIVDDIGWTCLHEAARYDSYECLLLILQHPDCNPLAETTRGETALLLACKYNCSTQIIKALLDSTEDIANYCDRTHVTPLHKASSAGRVDVIQMLIDNGAMLDVQNVRGDTPLHNAVQFKHPEAAAVLLHAGADPEIGEGSFIPIHMACFKSCYEVVYNLIPFVADINRKAADDYTPLHLAVYGDDDIINLLLKNGGDPYFENDNSVLKEALWRGEPSTLRTLFNVMDTDKIFKDIIPFTFQLQTLFEGKNFLLRILDVLLNLDLGPDFFDFVEPFYSEFFTDFGRQKLSKSMMTPLSTYFKKCEEVYNVSPEKFREFFYIFLMNGAPVDALDVNECPPLISIHYCEHKNCFKEVFTILMEQDCNVDYRSDLLCGGKQCCIPDAFLASLFVDPTTSLIMLPYSLHCEPELFLKCAEEYGRSEKIPLQVKNGLLSMIDSNYELKGVTAESLSLFVPSLKHLSRLKIRSVLRNRPGGVTTTRQYLDSIERLRVPPLIRNYLRYRE